MSNHERSTKAQRPRSLRSDNHASTMTRSSLALGLSVALMLPIAGVAQTSGEQAADDQQLPEIKTTATAIDPNPNAQTGVPYKARTSGDPRHTRPLAETPQTIQVITRTAIDESGDTDLKKILDAQPGITLGTGENGNAFGDRYIIRGQEARSDVFVDGLRDPGMTTRESFAVDQIEVSKGPNSTFAGRGTAGGAINAITKQATLDYDFIRASTGAGTDSYGRVTADINKILTDSFAVRANLLYAKEDVPDRSPADRERKGVALSGLYEFSPDFNIVLDYYGLRAEDSPDLGGYLIGTVPHREPARNVPSYVQDQDFLKSDVDTVTARIQYKFSPAVSITSLTRYGESENGYVVTGSRSATAYQGTGNSRPYTTASVSTHNGWQEVEYLAHQTNLRFDSELWGRKNDFIVGVEYTDHKVLRGSWSITNAGAFNCRTSANGSTNNGYCILNPDGSPVTGLNSLLNRQITRGNWTGDWQVKAVGLSLMDTIDLTDNWTLFTGLRADRFDFDLATRSGAGVVANYDYKDTLFNGHLGVSYKVAPNGIVYASWSSATDINGGESDTGTSSGYGGAVIYNGQIAGADPETSRNIELGTKWDLFDSRLLATAAVFQTVKSDVMEGANYDSFGTFNTGKNQVRGIEFGLVGNFTDKLTAQAGVAFLKSKVLESATAANIGKPLSNFADRSASVQLKYQFTDQFAFGGAARYESERCGGQPDTGAGYTTTGYCSQPVKAYTVYDFFASYRFNKHLDARLNLLNAFDKDYYTAVYRSGSFLYMGDARAVRLTLNYAF